MAYSRDQTWREEFEEELSCTICLEMYRDPVTLPCQHNFCRGCLDKHIQGKLEQDGGQTGSLLCPNCREPVDLKDGAIDSLPQNFTFKNIIDKFNSLAEKIDSETICQDHNKILFSYCNTCGQAMCCMCIPVMSHEGHDVVQFDDKMKMLKEEVEQTLLPQVAKLQDSLNENKKCLTESELDVQETFMTTWTKVVDNFQELRSAMNQKESELTSTFETKKREVISMFDTNLEKVDGQLKTVVQLHTKFSAITLQGSIEDFEHDKARCEEVVEMESTMTKEIKTFLDAMKKLKMTASSQLEELCDTLTRMMAEITGMVIPSSMTCDVQPCHEPHDEEATPEVFDSHSCYQLPTVAEPMTSNPAQSNTMRFFCQKGHIQITDPNTGKDISSEIQNERHCKSRPHRSTSSDAVLLPETNVYRNKASAEEQHATVDCGRYEHRKKRERPIQIVDPSTGQDISYSYSGANRTTSRSNRQRHGAWQAAETRTSSEETAIDDTVGISFPSALLFGSGGGDSYDSDETENPQQLSYFVEDKGMHERARPRSSYPSKSKRMETKGRKNESRRN